MNTPWGQAPWKAKSDELRATYAAQLAEFHAAGAEQGRTVCTPTPCTFHAVHC